MNYDSKLSYAANSHYAQLFLRNKSIISDTTQSKLRGLCVLVAGCGSTGGAFIEGASRVGVARYKLVDPDTYSLHNLNRQFVFPEDVGKNKARVHESRLKKLFQQAAEVEVDERGIVLENIEQMLKDVDLIFDAVDVTTQTGMKAKLALHQQAAQKKKFVLSSLDLGFKQWICVYDYRHDNRPLYGRLAEAERCENPFKALLTGFCLVDHLNHEILQELMDIIDNPQKSISQLGAACHLLAAFASPILIRFVEGKSIPYLIELDLMSLLESPEETKKKDQECNQMKSRLQEWLKQTK